MVSLHPLATICGLALATPALAGPTFVSDILSDASLARRAWAAGATCTGWVAPHHQHIEIRRVPTVEGYAGRAYVDADGLHRVEISDERTARTLIHEIAHAWASRGPATLTEGRADLLADCIATRLPALELLDPDPGDNLDHLPDLRRWTQSQSVHTSQLQDRERAHAYLGSSRLLRVIATIVPREQLWPRDGSLRWRDLEDLLEAAGPHGAIVLDVLSGGAERQAEALTDHDRDGLPWLAEILGATDPDAWDSDGDGWWDGAPQAPAGSVPLPPDGSAVCSGLTASPHGGRVQVRSGVTRASHAPKVRVIAGDTWILDDPAAGVAIPPSQPVLLALDGGLRGATGGAWALAGGQQMSNAWNCRSTPTYTVWLADPTLAPQLLPFVKNLDEHLNRARGLVGSTTRRIVVGLGAPRLHIDTDGVRLPTALLTWAQQHDRLDAVAGLAVALHRAWLAPPEERRWDTAEALMTALIDDPTDDLFVGVDELDIRTRADEAAQCGWRQRILSNCPEVTAPRLP